MARLYIDADMARFSKAEANLVDVEFSDGRKMESLEPRRLFPVSGLHKYITLLDSEGNEKAIIRDLNSLMPQSRKIICDSLGEYYMIPRITRMIDSTDKFGMLRWTVETDHGVKNFAIRNRYSDIKSLFDGRILIRDSDDNRYEIPDISKLDKKSQYMLYLEL
jgi:hypothetical protein